MKKNIVFMIWCCCFSIVFAGDAAHELLLRLSHNKTLQANFTQLVYADDGHVLQQTEGVMKLSRPGRFYWQLDAPSNQVIIANGSVIWIYDKDLEQVVKQSQADMDTLPAQLLSGGLDQLDSDYKVSVSHHGNGSSYVIVTDKMDAGFARLILNFERADLTGMTMFDTLGQKTVFTFKHVILNASIDDKWYVFVPPKGVDVITQ